MAKVMKFLLWLLLLTGITSTVLCSSSTKRNSRHHRINKPRLRIFPSSSLENSSVSSHSSPDGFVASACESWWCGRGKECLEDMDGVPQCICIRECPLRAKSICGTDGHLYHSHCELHRAACRTKTRITIDHSKRCLKHSRPPSFDDSSSEENGSPPSWSSSTNNQFSSSALQSNWKLEDKPSSSSELLQHHNHNSDLESSNTEEHSGTHYNAEGESSSWLESGVWKATAAPTTSTREFKLKKDEGDVRPSGSFAEEEQESLKHFALSKADGNYQSDMDLDSVLLSDEQSIAPGINTDYSSACSPQEYEILKDNLLLYNHERMIGGGKRHSDNSKSVNSEKLRLENAFGDRPEAGKDYLLSLMFSHLDRNNNGALEYDELHKADVEDNVGTLSSGCKLTDFLLFDDPNHDRQLHINEFYLAFSKLYSVTMISLDKALEITHKKAIVGDNVELKCAVTGSPPTPVVWNRYGVDLSTLRQQDQIRVNIDGTLYLGNIQMLHSGNYCCHAQRNQEVVQTHVLTVQQPPSVTVIPHIIWEKPGEEVTLECRVSGDPIPEVQWLRNDDPLSTELPEKYIVSEDGTRLTLRDIYYTDTGAYMCKAQNPVGKRMDVASLVVIDQPRSSAEPSKESQLIVFHSKGASSFNPNDCRLLEQIMNDDLIPGTQDDYLCGKVNAGCEWGRALRISGTSYVYASQPNKDRILVFSISKNSMVVSDVISTDRYPVQLFYVPHMDQVWVECWGEENENSQKTLQVIRNAKERRKHNSVHPDPINSHFDLVENIFLPPDLSSSSQFQFAYVSHANVRKLYKLNLVTLRYTKSVDLTTYNCVPRHVQFSGLSGNVIAECFEPVTNRPTGRLVIDALTDAVISSQSEVYGRPYLSPESRKLLTVSPNAQGTHLVVQLIRDTGLESFVDINTSLNISDVAFFPSRRAHTFDIFATAKEGLDILFVDLKTGNTETISDVGLPPEKTSWSNPKRPLSPQNSFSKYIATTSSESAVVIDAISRVFNCEIESVVNPRLLVWM